jgi:hypothetical protein
MLRSGDGGEDAPVNLGAFACRRVPGQPQSWAVKPLCRVCGTPGVGTDTVLERVLQTVCEQECVSPFSHGGTA